MEVNNSAASPVVGLSGNGATAAKLKSSSSFSDSTSGCTSPLQGVANNSRNAPRTESNSEEILSKNGASASLLGQNSSFSSNDILPVSASCSSPTSANTTAIARPSTGPVSHSKRDGLKLTIRTTQKESRMLNSYSNAASPGDSKGNSVSSRREMTGGRPEKIPTQTLTNLNNEILRNSSQTRSLSVNKVNRTTVNNIPNTAKRYNSIDQGCHNRDGASPSNRNMFLNNTKFIEKGAVRHSPRTPGEYVANDARGRSDNDSPFNYPSPSSSENALSTSTVRGKTKNNFGCDLTPETTVSCANVALNHRMSRTSSNNSVSDLSACSEVTDEATVHGVITSTNFSVASDVLTNNVLYSSECNNTASEANNELNIDSSLLGTLDDDDMKFSALQSEKIGLSLEDVEGFGFPDNTTGPEDIGSSALNLSAEDIQQTLNSVSAESNLPDISIPYTDSEANLSPSTYEANSELHQTMIDSTNKSTTDFASTTDTNNASGMTSNVSASATNVSSSTSSMASVITNTFVSVSEATNSISKTTTSSMTASTASPSYVSESFHSSCSASTCLSSTTSVSYSPSVASSGSTTSQLQEILGISDTNRLKNMARPADPTQYQSSASTSFNNNFIKTNKGNVYPSQPSTATDRRSNQGLPVTSPNPSMPCMSPQHRFPPPGTSSNFPRHPMQQRHPNPPHQLHGSTQHGYEMHARLPLERSASFGDHPAGMTSRHFDHTNMPLHHHSIANTGLPYNVSSPQGMPGGPMSWQQQPPAGGMLSPSIGTLSDGNKSPRGQLSSLSSRAVNPMSGLQSTVDSIPNVGLMTKNNGNNTGPLQSSQISTPTGGCDFGTLPSASESRIMLPPPSLTHDKRSVSVDSTLGVASTTRTKGNKRERGLSVDSKDGEKKGKESGPKPKRRKSKSKDESKKSDLKTNSRSNSVSDAHTNSYFCVFNTEIANKAASSVLNQSIGSIISYHQRYQGNCRLLPSKPPSVSPVNRNNFGLKSPSAQASTNSTSKTDVKPSQTNQLPNVSSIVGNNSIKSELLAIKNENNSQMQNQDINLAENSASISVKSEPNSLQESNPTSQPTTSPIQQQVKHDHEEDLSDEQKKRREQNLNRIDKLKKVLLRDKYPVASSSNVSWPSQGNATNKDNYAMTRHLMKKVQEMSKDNSMNPSSTEGDWFRLIQAYNEEKRRNRLISSGNPDVMSMDGMTPDPPPYHRITPPAGPSHHHQRWMVPGHPGREPNGVGPDLGNPRYPHGGIRGPVRLPHDAGRYPSNYPPSRFPRGYAGIVGSANRMPMYSGPNVQPGLISRPAVPRLPQSHAIGPTNESYPFSDKLKQQASMYQSEVVHGPPGPVGYELNSADPSIGPRLSSPEWGSYGNSGSVPMVNRLSRMQESISPTHGPVGASGVMIPTPGSIPGQVLERTITPSGEPPMDPSTGLRMNNSSMPHPYSMASYVGKGVGNLPTYPDSSMSGISPLVSSFPSQDMRPPSSNMPGIMSMPHDGSSHSSMMVDAMARRGEPRPPDLNINPNVPRSPLPFQGGRPPVPSPSMGPNAPMGTPRYMSSEMGPGGLPQMSPHPHMVRSPMVNSPGIMKSPVQNQISYMSMGQPSGMQPMEQQSMMSAGPQSAGPSSAPPVDWMSMPQSSMGVKDGASPPPLTHMNGNQGLPQEPPPLSHNPAHVDPNGMHMGPVTSGVMIRGPSGSMMPQHNPCRPPGYDPGPHSVCPRPMVSMMGEGFNSDFSRPPSHPNMCMSPNSMHNVQQSMVQPGLMEMHGPPVAYMSQSNMMPPCGNGVSAMPSHPGNQPPNSRIPEFDLTGIIPSDKPSQTLSYFPSGRGNSQDTSQMDPVPNPNMQIRSPPIPQQSMNRYPSVNMGQRPLTPGGNTYMGANPGMRMPGPANFIGPNPPNYPGPAVDDYLSPSWESMGPSGMVRPQTMPNRIPNIHPGY